MNKLKIFIDFFTLRQRELYIVEPAVDVFDLLFETIIVKNDI